MSGDYDEFYSGLSDIDYWRLSDALSVVDASFLAIGVNPGNFQLSTPADPASSKIVQIADFTDYEGRALANGDLKEIEYPPTNFRAVFKAIRNAIFSNKIRATLAHPARYPQGTFDPEMSISYPIPPTADEEEWDYGVTVSFGAPKIYSNIGRITEGWPSGSMTSLYVRKEPDWSNTMVEVDELKRWFKTAGIAPAFYFPEGAAQSFKDREHRRYSAKLATAVAAWEAVARPYPNKSVKQSLTDWIVSNGIRYGLGNNDGVVTNTVAEEVAKTANWQTLGGATPTYTEASDDDDEMPENIENFSPAPDQIREDDDPIPF